MSASQPRRLSRNLLFSGASLVSAFSPRLSARALLATTFLFGLAAPVSAQLIPVPSTRELIDGNGVDLFRGVFTVDETIASVGAAQGLSLRRISRGSSQFMYNVEAYISGTSTVHVTVNGRTDRFTRSGSNYISTEGNGSKLTFSNNIYTYTTRDGTVVTFDKSLLPPGYHPYGSEGVVTSITEPNGASLVMTYQQSNLYCEYYNGDLCAGSWMRSRRLASISSGPGYSVNYSYASNTIEDGSQVMPWYEITSRTLYNGATPVAADTSPNHLVNSYVSASGKITGVRRPGSASNDLTIGYDGSGRVLSVADHKGTTTYAYSDLSGLRMVTVTRVGGGMPNEVNTFTFNIASERMNSFKDALNHTTSYTYDGSARLTRITKPEGNYTNFTYDARGNVTEVRNVGKSGSGVADIVTSAVFPATCTNVACNQPTSTTDARGNATDYTYNTTHGGVLTITAPAPTAGAVRPKQTFAYTTQSGVTLPQSVSQCTTLASCAGTADEVKASVTYDAKLLPTQVSTGNGTGTLTATTTLAYDVTGNLVSVDGPLAGTTDTTTAIYDSKRRPVGTITPDPDGAGTRSRLAERRTFATNGDLTKVEIGTVTGTTLAALNAMTVAQATEATHDADGRKLTDLLVGGGSSHALTQYSYDSEGRVTCAAQRMNAAEWASLPADACTLDTVGSFGPDRITKTLRDANGRPTEIQVAFGTADQASERKLSYADNGQLLTLTDGENNRTTYEYDGHDRLVKTRFPVAAQGAQASSTSDYEQLIYDAGGNVTTRRLRDGQSIGYTYDALSRLTDKNLPGSEADAAYSYDLLNRMTSAVQGGITNSMTWDALGRMLTETAPQGTVSSQYDLSGRRTRVTLPGATTLYAEYVYDLVGNVTAIRENGATSGVGVLATYAYDNFGRRTSVTFGNGVVQGFTYDAASRLATHTNDLASTANDLTATFAYNPASQIASVASSNHAYAWTGAVAVNRGYSSNGLNQHMTAGPATFAYDGRGNLTGDGTTTYAYDSENKLLSASGSASGTLSYDPMGRLYQVTGGGTTRFGYDGVDRIAEYDGSNAVLRRYIHGPGVDDPIAWYEGTVTTNRRFLSSDERGSIITVTDGAGGLLGINSYDEYGIPAPSNIGAFGYTGQAWLPQIGVWYYKARMMSPTLGRFLQTDAVGYSDGMNWYTYVSNDPVNMSDASGDRGLTNGERAVINRLFPGVYGPGALDGFSILKGPVSRPGVFFQDTVWANSAYVDDFSVAPLGSDPFNTFLHELWHTFEKDIGFSSQLALSLNQIVHGFDDSHVYDWSPGTSFNGQNAEARADAFSDCFSSGMSSSSACGNLSGFRYTSSGFLSSTTYGFSGGRIVISRVTFGVTGRIPVTTRTSLTPEQLKMILEWLRKMEEAKKKKG